jgi:hypothetical protein
MLVKHGLPSENGRLRNATQTQDILERTIIVQDFKI